MESQCFITIITIICIIIFCAVEVTGFRKGDLSAFDQSTLHHKSIGGVRSFRLNNDEIEESIHQLHTIIRTRRAALAGQMEMMKFLRAKRGTVDPLIVPLMFVVDHTAYQKFEKNASRINDYGIALVNQMNALFDKLFLKVVLTDVLIWSERDSIKVSNDASKTMVDFDAYNRDVLMSKGKHTHAQLITGQDLFDAKNNIIMGIAAFNTICTESSSSVVMLNYSDTVELQALFSTHELAHSLDIGHTSSKCPTCIMAPNVQENPERRSQWTVGNIKNFTYIIEDKQCLFVEQSEVKMFEPNTCGNEIAEEFEDCDIGQRDIKKADYCDAWTCHAAPGSADVSYVKKSLMRAINDARTKSCKNKQRELRSIDNSAHVAFPCHPNHNEGPLNVTLLFVVDNAAYQKFNRDAQRINEFFLELIANINSTFSKLYLQTELADVVIWNEKDYFKIEKNAVKLMNDFQEYNKNVLLKNSNHIHAQLITGVPQYDDNKNLNFGRAKLNTICTEESSSVVMLHDMDAKLQAVTSAHELAHAFNIKHSDNNCSECLMAPGASSSGAPSDKWIISNFDDLKRSIDTKMCLFDKQSKAEKFQPNFCGNGALDEGEECDIGQRDKGNTQCCNPWTCQFLRNENGERIRCSVPMIYLLLGVLVGMAMSLGVLGILHLAFTHKNWVKRTKTDEKANVSIDTSPNVFFILCNGFATLLKNRQKQPIADVDKQPVQNPEIECMIVGV